MSDKNVIGIIPARMSSTRFPGKPLALIHGMPMIGHVFKRSAMARSLKKVYVATCDAAIADYAESIGAPAIMTSPTHMRATERTSEAVDHIERETGTAIDIVVLIQGDEPMVVPEMIDIAVEALVSDQRAQVVNLASPIQDPDDIINPDEIKVVTDTEGFAMYFSRSPIPHCPMGRAAKAQKQVCIMPFRRVFLATFDQLAPTPLEIAESIDMLRIIEHGYKVKMVESQHQTVSVDTPADLLEVTRLLASDLLMPLYNQFSREEPRP